MKYVERLPNGGYRYTTVDKFSHIRSIWEDVEFVANERGVNRIHSSLMDVTAYARFERLAGGRTRASNVAEVRFHGGPLGRLGELLLSNYIGHGAERAMDAARVRMEARSQVMRDPS